MCCVVILRRISLGEGVKLRESGANPEHKHGAVNAPEERSRRKPVIGAKIREGRALFAGEQSPNRMSQKTYNVENVFGSG